MTTVPGSRPVPDDRGSVLVESAFVLPIVLLLVFGIIELGFLYDSATVTSSASRGGARLASATYGFTDDGTERAAALDNIRSTIEDELRGLGSSASPVQVWVYQADTDGTPQGVSDFSSCTSECVVFSGWDGSTFQTQGGSWSAPDACGETLDWVGIYLDVDHGTVTGVYFDDFDVDEYTVMQLEPRTDC